jgi:hypothetical protein
MSSKLWLGSASALMLAAGLAFSVSILDLSAARADTLVPQAAANDKAEGPLEATVSEEDDEVQAVDANTLDWSQLDVDAYMLVHGLAPKARAAVSLNAGDSMTWSSNGKPNGSSDVSVKQAVSPFWDTRVGADMMVAREPTTMSELLADKSTNGGNLPQSSGSAWAAMSAPGAGSVWDKTAVEARVDPAQDKSKLGTSISKQVTITDQTSITLENGGNVIQQGTVTGPGIVARPTRNYDTEQSAKLSNTDTGTSVTAGESLSTSDDKWTRKIGAEQQLFDGVTVSGSVSETAQGATNKSISAGYKHSW